MNDYNAVRCRIAPSPTGVLHIGTARTALFNYLFAKKNGGKFFLRIEDTDKERSTKEFESEIISSLQWLGIHWDSEVTRQSERAELHSAYLKKLYSAEKIYYCFHTVEELSAEGHQAHICEYRDLPKEEVERRLKSGESTSVMRFKTQPDAFVVFHDLIRGEVKFHSRAIGDFSVAKNINEPLYNFAVVIDDADAGITHVIRGEDHISNTPKQILILGALHDATGEEKFKQPVYAHLPLILGSDKSKLSKRHGATSVSEFRDQGYLSEALVNFMALLGWNPGDEREFFTLEELVHEFTIEKVQKSGAIFNQERLDFVNGHYIRQTSVDELTKLCLNIPSAHTPEMKDDEYTRKIIALESSRL
ncbi:MAG: glutamate--tRNA ligase, partial [Patescibacteria group bacterium]